MEAAAAKYDLNGLSGRDFSRHWDRMTGEGRAECQRAVEDYVRLRLTELGHGTARL